MQKVFFFILLYTGLCHFSSAQKSDTLTTSDTTRYDFNHSSTGMINNTNVSRSFLLNNLLKFNIVRKYFVINTINGWVYGKQEIGLTNNDFSSSADIDILKNLQKLYYWGLINYDKSFSLKINNRLQTGIGVGYSIFTKPNFELIVSDGLMYEYTSLYDIPAYSTPRNSFRLKYHFILGKIVVFDGTNFLQQSLLSENDYILKFTNSISLKLKSWLSFTVAATYNKINLTKEQNFICNIGFAFQKTYTHVNRK